MNIFGKALNLPPQHRQFLLIHLHSLFPALVNGYYQTPPFHSLSSTNTWPWPQSSTNSWTPGSHLGLRPPSSYQTSPQFLYPRSSGRSASGTRLINFPPYHHQPKYVFPRSRAMTSQQAVSVTQQPRRLVARTSERSQSPPIIGRSHSNTIVGMDERNDDDDDVGDAETVPELIEGDIAIDKDQDSRSRLAIDFIRHPAKKWPNNTVPYLISANYTTSEELMIENAMKTISFLSCIKFIKWDGKRKDYIHFHPHKKRLGCWSYIGRQNKRQQLSLQKSTDKDCNCFCSPGRAMHEIMHALGFYHEHARADRDQYIKIIKKNVRKGKHGNFNYQYDNESTRNYNYDYNSIMHYGPYYFSKNKRRKKATIVPLKPGQKIGQRDMLSKTDCMKLNSQYNCFNLADEEQVLKTRIICAMVGV